MDQLYWSFKTILSLIYKGMKCKTCKAMGGRPSKQCPMCESESFMDQMQYERLISITIAHWIHNIVPESYKK